MSRRTAYRLYFNNQAATREQLDRVESIAVEQELDMAWEARLEVPICVDGWGRWRSVDEAFLRPFTRVRVEVSLRDDRFVPLIDGTILDLNSRMQFEPGRSTVTLTIRDDSVLLNKNDEHFSFDEETDYEIVEAVFSSVEQIARSDIDEDLRQSGGESSSFRANGTAMQVLMSLAQVHDKHVYVLPGENPGESIGCCKALPGPHDRQPERLPTMVLLGQQANIRELNVGRDLTQPAEYSASTVQTSDKNIVSSTASFRDRETLGERAALPEGQEPARRILRPNPFFGRHPDRASAARAESSSFAFLATGSVLEGCYPGVLQPYRLVTVQAGETPLSGDYVVRQVTHTLGRSLYTQTFTLMRNAESETGGESLSSEVGGIF